LSKFYQRVLADELAQHMRRVIWRCGDLQQDPDVYVTTPYNFGNKSVGWIAITIATTQEIVRLFV
jgi:hypothetical protein